MAVGSLTHVLEFLDATVLINRTVATLAEVGTSAHCVLRIFKDARPCVSIKGSHTSSRGLHGLTD